MGVKSSPFGGSTGEAGVGGLFQEDKKGPHPTLCHKERAYPLFLSPRPLGREGRVRGIKSTQLPSNPLNLNIPPQRPGQFGGAVTDLLLLGLIGHAGMFAAIGTIRRATTTEAKAFRCGIANGPFAHVRAKGQNRGRAGLFIIDRRRAVGWGLNASASGCRLRHRLCAAHGSRGRCGGGTGRARGLEHRACRL